VDFIDPHRVVVSPRSTREIGHTLRLPDDASAPMMNIDLLADDDPVCDLSVSGRRAGVPA
jgi:hypothetical protein